MDIIFFCFFVVLCTVYCVCVLLVVVLFLFLFFATVWARLCVYKQNLQYTGKNGEALSNVRCAVVLEHEMLEKIKFDYNMITDNDGYLRFPNLDLGFKSIQVQTWEDVQCEPSKWRLNQSSFFKNQRRFVHVPLCWLFEIFFFFLQFFCFFIFFSPLFFVFFLILCFLGLVLIF